MDDFGEISGDCPKCAQRTFKYGCSILENGASMVATGKCDKCGFVPSPMEWKTNGVARAEEVGWSFLSDAYAVWSAR